ncbi:hypothetical protein [Christiangramia salexigens]|uniref:Outer membrane protein beta-barrel domain-containing protein n=1 Tax=Christiangramia salexigens TaxID=1913577 RepID=A0A1L3J6R6_9FLAO|nr:hypothetical protein [Christiangramia salexigens]APG60845.1 hypothetical protein LPB144_10695 [Christiangramia salexigens]
MKEKKNIDRIFQEGFKDFEENPSDKIWDNIEAELDKRDGKKPFFIPLWFKIGGAAAVLALILASLIFTNTQDPFSGEPEVVFENPESESNIISRTSSEPSDSTNIDPGSNNSITSKITNIPDHQPSTNSNPSKSSASDPSGNRVSRSSNFSKGTNKTSSENNAVSYAKKKNSKTKAGEEARIVTEAVEIIKQKLSAIAQSEISNNESLENSLNAEENNALVELEKNKQATEDLEEKDAKEKFKKLRFSTFAAPVVYQNIGSGNEISSQFDSNSSSSEVTISYGVKLAYALSDKIKIRTGVSKINMSYDITGISYTPAAIVSSLENIRPTEDNLDIRSDAGPGPLPTSLPSDNSLSTNVFTPGKINQQFGFIEVPLEIEFSLIDSRFGLNLIGGGSSLFLNTNSVDLISGNNSTNLGEASNINDTSFSTNIGFGMDYKLNDKFSINVEPIFKYQLNTFNNVNNVRPVNFGVYSGLSIKF